MANRGKSIVGSVSGTVMLLGTGCAAPNQFSEPIGKLGAATDVVLTKTLERIDISDKSARDLAYSELYVSNNDNLLMLKDEDRTKSYVVKAYGRNAQGNLIEVPPPLNVTFASVVSPRGKAVRKTTIQEVKHFVSLLSGIAGSTVEKDFGAKIETIGTQVTGLGDLFSSGDPSDASWKNLVTSLGPVITSIGSAILEGRRQQAIEDAADKAAPKIIELVKLLKQDMTLIDGETFSTMDEIESNLAGSYKDNPYAGQDRLYILNEFQKLNAQRLALKASEPDYLSSLDELAKTMKELKEFKAKKSFDVLIDQVDAFVKAVLKLRVSEGGV